MRVAWLVALSACMLLSACSAEPEGFSAEQQAQASAWRDAYQAYREREQFELAEQEADRLLAQYGDSEAAQSVRVTLADTREHAQTQREQRRLASLWDYQRIPVAGGEQVTAAIYSHSEVDPDAEVVPVPDARLVLRRHPDWGRSAYLLLNQRQLDCGPPCVLSIRFDRNAVQTFRGKPADSGSGPALFIVEDVRFREAMASAQTIRIELPRSKALVPVFVFEVGGFSASQFDP